MKSTIKLGLLQFSMAESISENLSRGLKLAKDAVDKGADVILFPELFLSKYFCLTEDYQFFNLAININQGEEVAQLSDFARLNNVEVFASLFESRSTGIYHNTTVVFGADGTQMGRYRKMHIPDDPGYYEKFYFTPGDLGFKVFNTRKAKIGTLVCWDQWFPEAARLTSLMGARLLTYPTAIGWPVGQDEDYNKKEYSAWQTIQRSHAIANGVFVASINRVGTEDETVFWGGSFVADPFGEVIFQAPHDEENAYVVEIDVSLTEFYKQRWPFFRDRRVDAYNGLLNISND